MKAEAAVNRNAAGLGRTEDLGETSVDAEVG